MESTSDMMTRFVCHDETPLEWLEEWDHARLSAHIDLVKRGVRSAAHLTIRKTALQEVCQVVERAGLYLHVEACGRNHSDVTLFAHLHLKRVIPALEGLSEPARTWAYGKLFGYSEDAIGKFIRRDGGAA
jgi:hypothetical protein